MVPMWGPCVREGNMSKNTLQNKLPLTEVIPLALQHVVAMVVGCITVPIIASNAAGLGGAAQVKMIQASLLCAGVAILFQNLTKKGYLGAGLPLIVGSGFAFIATMSEIAKNQGIEYVFGAQLVATLFGIGFGFLFKYIKKLFTPVVKAVVVMTIGISLYKTAVTYIAGGAGTEYYGTPKSWALGIFTMIVTLLLSQFGKGFFKVAATLLGLIIGYLAGLAFGLVHFDVFTGQAPFQLPTPIPFGLKFSFAAIVPYIVITLISAVQDIGQLEATTFGLWQRSAKDEEVRGGIIGDNIGSLVGAIFGGAPNAIAGQNVGIVVTTGVTAKLVFVLAGALLILIGFFPPAAAIFLTIPYPVLGGATIAVFGSIATTGIKMLAGAGLTQRNVSIAGLSLALAIGMTYDKAIFQHFPDWVAPIFGNAVVVAALVSILLNLVIPKDQTTTAK